MVDIEILLSRIEGIPFIKLSEEEQQTMAYIVRPDEGKPFHKAQQYLISNIYLLVDTFKSVQLSNLNKDATNVASPIILKDGRLVLPASLLSNCRPGETYGHLREFLFTLPFCKVDLTLLPDRKGIEVN